MGAFSFAADTLATLSSAFSPKNALVARANVSKLSITLDENAQRIFTEFSTGMKMLHLHGSRNPCNTTKITNQNLKLLHTNLKSNKSYRKAISDIRNNAVDTEHWAWLPLISNADIEANMLFLPAGTSISSLVTGQNGVLQQQAPESHLDASTQKHHYVSLLGYTEFDISRQNRTSSILLRSGDVFAETNEEVRVKHLRAMKGNSLILNIHLPTA